MTYSFHDDSTKRVADENDGPLSSILELCSLVSHAYPSHANLYLVFRAIEDLENPLTSLFAKRSSTNVCACCRIRSEDVALPNRDVISA